MGSICGTTSGFLIKWVVVSRKMSFRIFKLRLEMSPYNVLGAGKIDTMSSTYEHKAV